jgi:hypothetical protein
MIEQVAIEVEHTQRRHWLLRQTTLRAYRRHQALWRERGRRFERMGQER